MNNHKRAKKIYAVNSLVISLSAMLAILIVAIIFLTINVNFSTNDLADYMAKANNYQQAATMLQAGTSVLSETATNFVQNPSIPAGPDTDMINTGPITAYAQELMVDRRGPRVSEQFRAFGVDEEIQGYIDAAAKYSEEMRAIQTHAISLIVSVYPFPDEPLFESIPLVELTAEEMAMPKDERIATAKSMLVNKNYAILRSYVSNNIENCHRTLQEQFEDVSVKTKKYIRNIRIALWAIFFLIITILTLSFVVFYRWIILPLNQCSKDMTSDKEIQQQGRIKEFMTMVTAYNGLLDRRYKLETILRNAAETDPLTGLPNRYYYEQSILDVDKKDESIAVMLFDVNYLKVINDTKGHAEGDNLLRKAAEIIVECFGEPEHNNCYRIGGDEFASILRGYTEEDIKNRIDGFDKAMEREEISISVGYAFAETAGENNFRQLAECADERMYADKKQHHKLAEEKE